MKKIVRTMISSGCGIVSGLAAGAAANVIARKVGIDEFTNTCITGCVTIGTATTASAVIYGKLPGDENPAREYFGKGQKPSPDKLAEKVLKEVED